MRKTVLTLLFIFSLLQTEAQVAELKIRKNFQVQIKYISDLTEVQKAFMYTEKMDADQICFKLSPLDPSEKLSQKEIAGLSHLKLYQGTELSFERVPFIKEESRYQFMLFFISKKKVKLTEPVTFKYETILSSQLILPESLIDSYNPLMKMISEAELLLKNNKHTEAFEALETIYTEGGTGNDYKLLSKYPYALDLTYNIIDGYLEKANQRLSELKQHLKEKANHESLSQLEILSTDIIYAGNLFAPYFNQRNPSGYKVPELKEKYDELNKNVAGEKTIQKANYERQAVSVLAESNYSNDSFKFIIESIVSSLVYTEVIPDLSALYLDSITGLNAETSNPNSKTEKSLTEGGINFKLILSVLNQKIKTKLNEKSQNNILFDEVTFKNIYNLQYNDRRTDQDKLETKPYYYILKGFDALMGSNKNINNFVTNIENARKLVADERLALQLEMWNTAVRIYYAERNKESVLKQWRNQVNRGIRFFNELNYDSAQLCFKSAINLYNPFPEPYFFLGLIYENKENPFLAAFYFKKATEKNPDYLPAWIEFTETIVYKSVAQNTINQIDSLLTLPSNRSLPPISLSMHWYFNFLKAKLNYILENYAEATNILQNECIRLNPCSPNIYILKGLINLSNQSEAEAFDNFYRAINLAMESYFDHYRVSEHINRHLKL